MDGQEHALSPRNHPLFRRTWDIITLAACAENDLHSLEQDEAHSAPYNLVKIVQHETGCTRQEAIDQVTRQSEDYYNQAHAILRYAPALLRASSSATNSPAGLTSVFTSLLDRTSHWRAARRNGRYRQTTTPEKRDLERLRREICHPATDPASTDR